MPRFIDNFALRTLAWVVIEAVHLALEPINRKLDRLMAQVAVEQADLDNVGAALKSLADTLNNVDTTPLAAGDETQLNDGLQAVQAAVTKLTGAATPVPAPTPDPAPGA